MKSRQLVLRVYMAHSCDTWVRPIGFIHQSAIQDYLNIKLNLNLIYVNDHCIII